MRLLLRILASPSNRHDDVAGAWLTKRQSEGGCSG